MKNTFIIIPVILFSLISCGQNSKKRLKLGLKYAETELNETLSQNKSHNVIDKKNQIIKNEITAIEIAELILFEIYGTKNITKQKPYESYLIKNYWVISGTLAEG